MKDWNPRRSDAPLLLLYTLLAVALTFPLVLHFTTHVPGRGTDDPALTWNLWWVKFALFDAQTTPLYSNYIYYPIGVNLVAYTSTFLNAVLALPLQFAFGVIAAQNLYTWFALTASAYGAYLLSREMLARGERFPPDRENATGARGQARGARLASAFAGAFYGFGAWHISYVAAGHFMLLSNQWLPFLALALFRLDRTATRWRDGLLAGLFFVFAAWTELTFLPFVSILTGCYLVYILLARRRALNWRLASNLVTLVSVVAVGVAPLAVNLFLDTLRYGYYLAPGLGRVQVFSAEPLSYFLPSFQNPLLGAWADAITNANTSYAFTGWAALALALLGIATGWKLPEVKFWTVFALVAASLLLGATLILNGQDTGIPMPFALLRQVPFLNANRYPVRFNVVLMLALTPLVAFGASRLWSMPRGWGRAVLAALALLFLVEQLVLPIPLSDLRAGKVLQQIHDEPGDFTVMDLPLGWRNSVAIQGDIDFKAQFLQTIHGKRLLGGLTSRNPLFKDQYYNEIPFLHALIMLEKGATLDAPPSDEDRAAARAVVRFFDIRYIEANRALTRPDVLAYVHAVLPLTEIGGDDERVVYRVELPSSPSSSEMDPASETAQMLFDDMWGRAQTDNAGRGFRWATQGQARIWLPLGTVATDVTFQLRGARMNQPVELRVNGHPVADWTVSAEWGTYTAHLRTEVLRDGLDELLFVTGTTPLAAAVPDDRTIGGTGIVAPVDLAVTGAGYDAGRFGEIVIGGRNLVSDEGQGSSTRGYHLAAVNPQTGQVDAVGAFDTFGDPDASRRLAEFVAGLPQGEIVAGAAIDEASHVLTGQAFRALQMLGVAGDVRSQFRAGHAFIGIKGIAPGQAVEDLNTRFPANVAVGKNVDEPQVAFALGPFEFRQQ